MNPDEFEYYFELQELEPFGGLPLAEHFGEPNSTRGNGQPPVPASTRPTRPQTDTSATEAARNQPSALAQTRSRPDDASRVKPSSMDAPASDHVRANDGSAREPSQKAHGTPPQSDTAGSSDRLPAAGQTQHAATSLIDDYGRHATSAGALSQRGSGPGESSWHDRMSVHVLGQFAFCGRAGIYSAENGEETDLDEPLPQWAYLPNFDLERIEEQLAKLLRQFWLLMGMTGLFVVGMVGGVYLQDRRIFYPALLGTTVCAVSIFNCGCMVTTLLWRRAAARRAQAREPDRMIDHIQQVNWWSLLKSGFDSVPCQRQFRHPHLPLEGAPWRVLERGSLRIPVIKSGAKKLGDAKHAIYPKHELRLAAYAMLLEATEHVQVPYGLVFPADSHLGLALPITESLREQVAEHLERASGLLARSQRGESEPRLPAERKRCATCRLGAPVPLSEAEIRSAKKTHVRLLVLKDSGERKFHCACGDRFGSAPPHRRIQELGLSSTVE